MLSRIVRSILLGFSDPIIIVSQVWFDLNQVQFVKLSFRESLGWFEKTFFWNISVQKLNFEMKNAFF